MDRSFIEAYATQGETLRRDCAGLSHDDLTARPGPGAWSILELVVHVADMDAVGVERIKRILTEDNPTLHVAHEDQYIARLFPHEQSLDDALTLFETNRRQLARVLRKLSEEQLQRTGTHAVRGPQSVAEIARFFTWHAEHHAEFLRGKRERLGKPIQSQ